MVKNTSYEGLKDISGNQILLENNGTKIILNFRRSFTFSSEFFTGLFRPRCLSGLDDNFEFNLSPKISDLHFKEMLISINLVCTEPAVEASFLSQIQKDCFDGKGNSANPPRKNEPPHMFQLKTRR